MEKLQTCSALIFPSVWYEGMPIILLEAFASGTPVIASKLGSMETMVTHGFNGLHFMPGDETDLLRKIECWNALTEAEKKQYSENAKKTYDAYYTPAQNLRQMKAIYQQFI